RVARNYLRAASKAQESWLRRAVDVGIENAGLEADRAKPQSEVDGRGRLADAAFARGDGNEVLHSGHRAHLPAAGSAGPRGTRLGGSASLLYAGMLDDTCTSSLSWCFLRA